MLILASCLPKGSTYSWTHFHTYAYKCKAPTSSAGDSYKAKHLFLLAEDSCHAVVFGVEVYVYFSVLNKHITRQIFVPKADTTGLGRRFSAAAVMESWLDFLLGVDVSVYFGEGKLSEENGETSEGLGKVPDEINMSNFVSEYSVVNDLRRLSHKLAQKGTDTVTAYEVSAKPVHKVPLPESKSETIKISMFTKAADAYLFPDSQKNPGKHVATGNELFKWWLTVLQKVVSKQKGWVLKADIPGSDSNAVQRLLPTGCSVGSIYPSDGDVLKTIPVFPDDPKGRFLEHLVVESRYSHMTVAQFWHELGYRQEFRLGSVVGIIGAEGVQGTCSDNRGSDPRDSDIRGDIRGDIQGDIRGDIRDSDLRESHLHGSTLVSVRKYKKLRDYVKGQDYSKLEDIQDMWDRGLRELCIRQKVKLDVMQTIGTRESKSPVDSGAREVKQVNVLQVKKRPAVNNINSLVKKKK